MGTAPVFMGTDWGTKQNLETDRKSFTATAIGGMYDKKFRFFYIEKYLGAKADLEAAPGFINSTAGAYNITYGAFDFGYGHYINKQLCSVDGWSRIHTAMIGSPVLVEVELSNMISFGKFDPGAGLNDGRYRLDRNQAIERFVSAIKNGQIEFPDFIVMKTMPDVKYSFLSDFLTVYREYLPRSNSYKYDHTAPDDVFHACMLCYFAWLEWAGQLIVEKVPRFT